MVEAERDAWILIAAQLPQHMSSYMKLKQQQLNDPATVELYREFAAAIDWEADDPRLIAVADRLIALLEATEDEEWDNHGQEITDDLAQLLDSTFLDMGPVAHQLTKLLEERGWRGWTKFERMGPIQT